MLAQQFPDYNIRLYDDRPIVPAAPDDDVFWSTDLDKRYLIGLGGRGITALERFGVWDHVVAKAAIPVPGRKDWNAAQGSEPIETIRTDKRYTTQVLPRDKLVSCLYQHIVDSQQKDPERSYAKLELCYGYKVEPVKIDVGRDIDEDDPRVLVDVAIVATDTNDGKDDRNGLAARFLVAADGSSRTFANEMERLDRNTRNTVDPFTVVRYTDDNQRVYKNIPFRIPDTGEWRRDMNYAVRTDRIIFDALPANDKGDYLGVLLMAADDEMAQANVDPVLFHNFLQDQVPQFVDLLDEATVTSVAKRSPSVLPRFRYVQPRLHQDYRTVLLGDCAKTVKPYFGMGANSALEEVKLLSKCIEENDKDLERAICDFSDQRAPDIQTLVRVSRDLDRPGVVGTFTFLIPIILDGIFSKLAPQVFAPNVISLLQDEELSFQDAAGRKRLDRAGQVAILMCTLLLFWEGLQVLASVLFSSGC